MQTITLEGVKEKAREAYRAGKLTAQHPNPRMRQCVYSSEQGDYHCAIGASLTPETLSAIDADERQTDLISVLIASKIVDAPLSELVQILAIQAAHDNWCHVRRAKFPDPEAEQRFKALIGL